MSATLILAALLPNANATWHHTGIVWSRDQFPLPWNSSAQLDDGLDPTYQEQVVQDAFHNWEEGASCAGLSETYGGEVAFPTEPQVEGNINLFWDDPAQNVGAGILGVTYTISSGVSAFQLNGKPYVYAYDSDIVFNDAVTWATSPDIDAGLCSGDSYSIEGVATHEVGHLWGLDHTCEDGDPCQDPLDREATMMWDGGPCSTEQITMNQYDVEGITALYGPYGTFDSSSDRFGGIPLTVDFQFLGNDQANKQLDGLTWDFGDGQTSNELNPSHTYEEQGQYTVAIELGGSSDACGDWSYSYRERAYVVACEQPHPGIDENGDAYEGMFTWDHYDGLTYQMLNHADTSVYGCIDTVRWDVYKDDELTASLSAWSPKIDFSDGVHGKGAGNYRIVLTLSGPGGASQQDLEITADDYQGENIAKKGCSALGSEGRSTDLTWIGVAGVVVVLSARRRRA